MHNAYAEVRLISHNMLPAELEEKGLLSALEKLVKDVNITGKIHIELNSNLNYTNIDKKIELEIYSICLELVNNILKHSEATEAKIEIFKSNHSLKITVKDNGIGFSNNSSNGIGMINIKNRVNSLNGIIETYSQKQTGSSILIEIPRLVVE
jgi:signal transduction histidine kinase